MPRRCAGTTSTWRRSSTGKNKPCELRVRQEKRLLPARCLRSASACLGTLQAWMDPLNGVIADGRQLTFYNIPWPVTMPARSFDELQASTIERFLLPHYSTTKMRKMRLRAALMQCHPDQSHVAPNLPVDEDGDNQPESSATPHAPVYPPHVRRTSDGIRAMQSPSTRRLFSSPGRHALSPSQHTPFERIIVAVTHGVENYVVADITGQTDARAIREPIIPDDLHPSFAIGGTLDNNQLLIDCQRFGDDRGSLKFLAQRADAPTNDVDIPVMPPSNAPVPPLLPRSASSASDGPPEGHANGYEASVSAISDFDPPDSENTLSHLQTRSPIQTLQRQATSCRGRILVFPYCPPSSSPARLQFRYIRHVPRCPVSTGPGPSITDTGAWSAEPRDAVDEPAGATYESPYVIDDATTRDTAIVSCCRPPTAARIASPGSSATPASPTIDATAPAATVALRAPTHGRTTMSSSAWLISNHRAPGHLGTSRVDSELFLRKMRRLRCRDLGTGVSSETSGMTVMERESEKERERERERQELVPIPCVTRQPMGTGPIPAPGYPASMPPVARATGEFGTSPCPAQGTLSIKGS
ncbi:hypothetical protein FS749_009960 [Ceratobasidium sp. UAMH 11750]|nr:hypothetical protein FS749_009960 [Ceratobasidium sp. UAMH 11750]